MGQLATSEILVYALISLAIWLSVLTFFLFKAVSHYKKLGKSENIKDLGNILEGIVKRQELQGSQTAEISKTLINHRSLSLGHFTKYALIRFNPFEDSGGDQSFTIALLDSRDNGIILSSLHSRSGTRVYAKEVIGAKAISHKLSKEEKEAVEKAARQVPNST